ncbi:class I SAM-dependent methyltransferase [Rubrobacter indicoceani]|uniref:class I SAM-dependent methyltransferase n=1 Tax=Rubrobacter indicoceani TaxID=2051957 RepID=UPI000E5B86AF|nr:methyltransferase domain-containing protein [Rubrobacter indicoceani]
MIHRYPKWLDEDLISPENGAPLVYETEYLLTDGERSWPVIEGIPYLRVGRDETREECVSLLRNNDLISALAVLLGDQDSWAPDPPPGFDRRLEVASGVGSLRRSMELLGFGRVGDYLIHRLSDPTYLAGLALLQDNLRGTKRSFQLACGLGHYSRELVRRDVETTAADVVFAKVWLARRYVTPETRMVCFDASGPFPFPEAARFDLVLCQDAFYFLPEKPHVASEMARLVGGNGPDSGAVLIGHTHNAAAENLSSGAPLKVPEYAALFSSPLLYDDEALTGNLLSERVPEPRDEADLVNSRAVCLVQNRRGPEPDTGLLLPPAGTRLRLNPLYAREGETDPACFSLRWPSERYELEYAPQSSYLPQSVEVSRETLRKAFESGVGSAPEVDGLARRRVLLDLPEGWW